MSYWTDDYQKPELIRISEQIFRKKEQKKELELTLSELKLQYRYISIRKNMVIQKALFQFVILVVTFLWAMKWMNNVFSMFWSAVLLFFDAYLLVKEVKVIVLLILSCNANIALDLADRYNIKTFPREKKRVEEQMQTIQIQIDELSRDLMELELQKKERLKEQEEQEAALRKEDALPDEKPSGNLSVKKSTTFGIDSSELYEYYIREKQYINEYLIKLSGKMQYIDKETVRIEEDFGNAKKKLLFFAVFFILIIIVQSTFEGIFLSVTNVICFVGGIFAIFFLESTCKKPILMYLIEQESNLTKEYAFVHNLTPIKAKRADLLEEIEQCKKEIAEIKVKMEELPFD